MKNLILIIFVFCFMSGFSQDNKGLGNQWNLQNERIVNYYYDNAGNRIQRKSIFIISPQSNLKIQIDTLVEQIAEKNILLYPNPVKETLNIVIEDYAEELGTVSAYSLDGKLIINKNITNAKPKLNFSNQQEGTYIVKINIGRKTKEYTVIKK